MSISFRGGLLPENRIKRKCEKVKNYFASFSVALPLEGRTPLVTEGSRVFIGQPIADGYPVLYATISGTVSFISAEKHGRDAIIIENDFENAVYSGLCPAEKPIDEFSREEIFEKLLTYAICESSDGNLLCDNLSLCKSAKRLIINCCECDFFGNAVTSLICGEASALLSGTKILMHALGASKAVFVCEESGIEAQEAIKNETGKSRTFVTATLTDSYPVCEQTIIQALYNREIPVGSTAAEIGKPVVSAETAIQVYKSFSTGMPQISKVFSIDGEYVRNSCVVRAPLGARISDVIEVSGGLLTACDSFIYGSLFNGRLSDTAFEEVFAALPRVLVTIPMSRRHERCIRCGKCGDVCPMMLSPMNYAIYYEKELPFEAFRHADVCIGCGCCEFICPTGVPLVQIIKEAQNAKNEEDIWR